MDKREYLRSQGFEVGERGRFSAEMLEALRSFDGEETQNRVVSRSTIVKSISTQQRDASVYMCVLEELIKLLEGKNDAFFSISTNSPSKFISVISPRLQF